MEIKWLLFLVGMCAVTAPLCAQGNCSFGAPFFRQDFGTGDVPDINSNSLALYNRVWSACPTDGHYAFASYTGDCFRGDWHTLAEDHTPGDANGNMLLVNSAYDQGLFFATAVSGFKPAKRYQFNAWLLNVCRPTRKCPFPLLPNLLIRLQTSSGKIVAQFRTGDIARMEVPVWTKHSAEFTMPVNESALLLSMINESPGGCGNDFALDDISFAECKPVVTTVVAISKQAKQAVAKKTPLPKQEVKKTALTTKPIVRANSSVAGMRTESVTTGSNLPLVVPRPATILSLPRVLRQRENPLVKQIVTGEGEIRIDLYDNGEIDGDTVSVYHNNRLVVSGQALSRQPITFRIQLSRSEPHHELIMVANNLGSIPPNTSLLIATVNGQRYEVYISSSEQKNARVVFDLKE